MSTEPTPWPSTKALSVYNTLRFKGAPTLETSAILLCLRQHSDPEYPEDWVFEGIEFLAAKGLVSFTGERVQALQLNERGLPAYVVKTADESDLELVAS